MIPAKFSITGIRTNLGTFNKFPDLVPTPKLVAFYTVDEKRIAMTPEQWMELIAIIPEVLETLGMEPRTRSPFEEDDDDDQ